MKKRVYFYVRKKGSKKRKRVYFTITELKTRND